MIVTFGHLKINIMQVIKNFKFDGTISAQENFLKYMYCYAEQNGLSKDSDIKIIANFFLENYETIGFSYIAQTLKPLTNNDVPKLIADASFRYQSTEKLIDRYTMDILYDAHQTETKIERSVARKELQRRGRETLKQISIELNRLFPPDEVIDYDLFMAWVSLIYGIIRDHKLPEPPYGPTIKYGDQKVEKWIEYCNSNG